MSKSFPSYVNVCTQRHIKANGFTNFLDEYEVFNIVFFSPSEILAAEALCEIRAGSAAKDALRLHSTRV
jgi:hypothetical protein